MGEPTFFKLSDVPWVEERKQENPAPEAMIADAEEKGARRKKLATGQCGYFSQFSQMPPGYEVPSHSHDHDELFVILSGGCTFHSGDDLPFELRAQDSAALSAGRKYGFECGPDGMEFMVIRPGDASSSYSK
jgi:quercetin dioxygenase-like cupin family protein